MRRKFLSVVLCVCMMLTMAPFAFAEGDDSMPQAETLQSKIDASASGTTIDLDKDYAESITIANNKTITLNLNGHKITNTNGQNTITVASGATLNVIDTDRQLKGSVDNTSHGKAALYNNGTTVISAGKWMRSQEAGTFNPYKSNGNSYYTILNHGDLTINSGSYANEGAYSSMIANGYYAYTYTGAGDQYKNYIEGIGQSAPTLTINAGTFTGGLNTIKNDDNGTTIINGGTFTNTAQDCVQNHNIVTINGGTFKGMASNGAVYNHGCDATYDKGELTITGGVFEGNTYALKNESSANTAKIEITGGRFSHSVSSFLSSPYKEADFGGKYAIVTTDTSAAVAEVNGNYFTTFPAAVAAAQTNQTVKLLKSVADSGVQFPGDDAARTLTIDLNGNTYTVMDPAVGSTGTETNAFQLLKGNTVTFKNGTVKVGGNAMILFQNYCNLTLEDVTVDCRDSKVCQYALSNNFGSLTLKGNTNVYAKSGYVAFDLWYGLSSTYYEGVNVTFDNDFTGTVSGKIEYGATTAGSSQDGWKNKTKLAINSPNGHFDITFVDSNPNDNLALKDANIVISGGYFTTDPTAYLATGKAAVESDLAGYNYKVANKSNAPATVAPVAPTVDINKLPEEQRETATQIANKLDSNAVTGDGLTAAAKTVANNNTVNQTEATNALTKEGITPTTDQTVRIVVQTYMNINIKNVDTNSADKKTLSLDITPMYRTVATTANTDSAIRLTGADVTDANAVLVGPAGKLIINKPVTIKIPLPTGFVSPATTDANAYPSIYVQHKGYEYTATVSKESDTLYATFTNPHGFSTFTITTEQTAEATLNGVNYTSFQDAVNAANNGDVITVLKDNLSATMSGSSRTITVKSSTGTFNVSVNGETKTADANTGVTFTYTHPSSGGPGSSGGSISTPTTYAVNVNAATNGAVAADKKTASKGTTVTVTASPSKGYVVDAVKVVDKDGKDVAVTEKDGKYVFTMPASAVTVTGSFKAETPAPVALPFTDVKSGNWFYDAVKYAYEQGLMTGTSATTFAPNGTMNRAMIVTVLYRLENSPAVTGASKFTDVPAGQWYSDAVAWAAANKIVNGYDETTFGPMNAVTREQMAAILFRYEQVKGLENVTPEENLNRFPDQNKISAYAIPALQWAVGQKIINGNADGTLDPTGTATRAQVAQIFTNLLNK